MLHVTLEKKGTSYGITGSPAVLWCRHAVTSSLVVWSHRHGQFWTVTDCDPSHSSKYSAYWSDYPLSAGHIGLDVAYTWQDGMDLTVIELCNEMFYG